MFVQCNYIYISKFFFLCKIKYCQLFSNPIFSEISFYVSPKMLQTKNQTQMLCHLCLFFATSDGYQSPDWHVPEFIDDT